VKIVTCRPTRAFFRPGDHGEVMVQVSGRLPAQVIAHVTVTELERTVLKADSRVTGSVHVIQFPLPTTPGRGYGVEVKLVDASRRTLARRSTAFDVQTSWVDAPRYGFLSEFAPDEAYEQRADALLERHINVVQFYDWMYRHYQYLPPNDTFTDILHRTLSLSSTRRAVAAVHTRGMTAMAYGSVYGAEPEYALDHPDELLYDDAGKPLSLDEAFYFQDVRPGPWRDRILGEYQRAVRDVSFDGIHADQYGFPKQAKDVHGAVVQMGPALAGIVGAAQRAVVDVGGDGIIFNCVTNWPIQDVAPEPQLCTYIEVWPPYRTLGDLSHLVQGAKQLAPERQVILAAYMSVGATTPNDSETATLLTCATIHASGGFHLLLGEGTGMLVDPYYPKFAVPGPSFQRKLVAHWDFIVRYGAYLFDRSLVPGAGVTVSSKKLWSIHRRSEEFETVSLINAQPGDLWDALKRRPTTRNNVRIELPLTGSVKGVFLATPDADLDAVAADFEHTHGTLIVTVPSVRIWTLVIIIR
jgi:dextranase